MYSDWTIGTDCGRVTVWNRGKGGISVECSNDCFSSEFVLTMEQAKKLMEHLGKAIEHAELI